jgi:hypothetical protein
MKEGISIFTILLILGFAMLLTKPFETYEMYESPPLTVNKMTYTQALDYLDEALLEAYIEEGYTEGAAMDYIQKVYHKTDEYYFVDNNLAHIYVRDGYITKQEVIRIQNYAIDNPIINKELIIS